MHRAVFLDRDNTLVHHPDDGPGAPERVALIQGAASAIASLRGLGYKIIVVTNQDTVAHGKQSEGDVDAVHKTIAELARTQSGAVIDRFYYCPFHPHASVEKYRRDHPWRKPQPGMILQAAKDLGIDPRQSWTVGSHMADVRSGEAAGTHTILLTSQPLEAEADAARPDFVARNLVEAARIIAQHPRAGREPLPEKSAPAARPAVQPPQPAAAPNPAPPPPPHPVPSASDVEWEISGPEPEQPPHPRSDAEGDGDASIQPHTPPETPETVTSAAPVDPALAPPQPSPRPAGGPADSAAQDNTPDPIDLLAGILRELKRQRADFGDFSWLQLSAVLIQIIVGGCVMFALLDRTGELFYQWMLGAIVGQLSVISALLARMRR